MSLVLNFLVYFILDPEFWIGFVLFLFFILFLIKKDVFLKRLDVYSKKIADDYRLLEEQKKKLQKEIISYEKKILYLPSLRKELEEEAKEEIENKKISLEQEQEREKKKIIKVFDSLLASKLQKEKLDFELSLKKNLVKEIISQLKQQEKILLKVNEILFTKLQDSLKKELMIKK